MKKFLKYLGMGLLALITGTLLYAYIAYPAEYVNRVLRWGNADVYDYQKFPERFIEASDSHFEFPLALNEDRVRTQFEIGSSIDDFDSFLAENHTQAFIVMQEDAIIYEQYFNGASRGAIVTSFSIAKSFNSTLIGLAIEDGYIESVDDPITEYIPELLERDPGFANITIRDLLMMSSGIGYQEFPFVNGDDAKTYYYPDLRKLALEETFIASKPGEMLHYNNYHPLLLGLVIERATGTTVTDYLQEKIWKRAIRYQGSFSLASENESSEEPQIKSQRFSSDPCGSFPYLGASWREEIIPDGFIACAEIHRGKSDDFHILIKDHATSHRRITGGAVDHRRYAAGARHRQ